MAELARNLRLSDIALMTVGTIIGTGIFRAPALVAQHVSGPAQIVLVWTAGGIIALLGAFVFGELAARCPEHGGIYAYLRTAFHPIVAFLFGWMTLIVSAGIAAAAVTFAGYVAPLTGIVIEPRVLAAAALGAFVAINCVSVRVGADAQNVLTLLKVAAIAALLIFGFAVHPDVLAASPKAPQSVAVNTLAAMAAAMIPVLFTYGGWHTTTFVTAETRDADRTLPLGLIIGIGIVTVTYVTVNVAMAHALGEGLAKTDAPAAGVLRLAIGASGERAIALIIVLSTLGFVSNRILVVPRLFQAMAQDGLFFRSVAWIHPKTQVPVVAILLQGGAAIALTLGNSYQSLVTLSTFTTFLAYTAAAGALFIFRKRGIGSAKQIHNAFAVPGHPFTTALFGAICLATVIEASITDPIHSAIGAVLVAAGIPLYLLWRYQSRALNADVGDKGSLESR